MTYIEIDDLYREIISKLDLSERIRYCENVIDEAQNKLLARQGIPLEIRLELYHKVLAAQAELKKLRTQ